MPLFFFCILEDKMYKKEGKSLQSITFDSKCLISNACGALFLEYSCESSTLGNIVTTSTYAKHSNIVFR